MHAQAHTSLSAQGCAPGASSTALALTLLSGVLLQACACAGGARLAAGLLGPADMAAEVGAGRCAPPPTPAAQSLGEAAMQMASRRPSGSLLSHAVLGHARPCGVRAARPLLSDGVGRRVEVSPRFAGALGPLTYGHEGEQAEAEALGAHDGGHRAHQEPHEAMHEAVHVSSVAMAAGRTRLPKRARTPPPPRPVSRCSFNVSTSPLLGLSGDANYAGADAEVARIAVQAQLREAGEWRESMPMNRSGAYATRANCRQRASSGAWSALGAEVDEINARAKATAAANGAYGVIVRCAGRHSEPRNWRDCYIF